MKRTLEATLNAANQISDVIAGAKLIGGTFVGDGKYANLQIEPSGDDISYEIEIQQCINEDGLTEDHTSTKWQAGEVYTQNDDKTDSIDIAMNAWYRFKCTEIDSGASLNVYLVG